MSNLFEHGKKHATEYNITAVLEAIGMLMWTGGTSWLDTRHIQREEHNAAIEAIKLEARCGRYYDRLSLLEARLGAANREQSKLRNYNRGASPGDTNYQARVDTIADLEADKSAIQLKINKLTEPTGCADE